ncbi:MAG: adenylate/guanylate cyclase domain-containing response regulator, partial [Geminicoccaceae bacterium]
EEARTRRIQDYETAFQHLETSTTEARHAFDRLVDDYPDDALIAFHQHRLAKGQSGTDVILENK